MRFEIFLQLEILGILNFKIGHLEYEIFKLRNENFDLKIWDMEFETKLKNLNLKFYP